MSYSSEFVDLIYNLPKTPEAISEFLNSEWVEHKSNGKIVKHQMWEKFEVPYVKVTNHYVQGTDDNEADVYIYAHKLLSKMVLAPVGPYFESDGQLFSYFQLMVKNSRINDSIKKKKQEFSLVGDMAEDCNFDEEDYSNFEESVFGSQPSDETDVYKDGGTQNVIDIIKTLKDPKLVLFGRLFIQNGYSFDGLQGLCGFNQQTFRDIKRKFIAGLRSYYVDC